MTEVGHLPLTHRFKYTIGTLVTDIDQYRQCVRSFQKVGFGQDDCQFLFIDNSRENRHTAYDGLNHILNHAEGEYIILCHQDILMDFDGREDLDMRLAELGARDPQWAVAGNAGGIAPDSLAIRITDPHGADQETHQFPQRVFSLDENFMVIRADARLAFSSDLSGFHFYGTDICVLADVQGFRTYVIDFHVRHLSRGNKSQSFYENEHVLLKKYGRAFRPRFVQSTCSLLYMTGNPVGVYVQEIVGRVARALTRRINYILKQFNRPAFSFRWKVLDPRES